MSSASTSSKRGGFKIRPLYQPLSDRRPSLGLLGGNGYKNRRFDPKYYGLLLLLLPFFYLLLRSGSPTIPFHHPLGEPYGNTTFAPTLARQIPPYVHYVFGLSPTFGGKSFAFIHYVCLSSALVILKPEVIYMHYVYEPTGWWWEQYKERVAKSGTTRLQMVKQRDVTSVFGNSIEHFAHKADVLRLEVLRDYGGIYLDSDVMVIKDLAPLYRHEAVMAMESQPNLDPALPPSGLCNAVVLAKPYSSFIGGAVAGILPNV
ncbi:glycosyltransferase family 32 protein [Pseudohyphozyma bogoriensis]|nr:glycosyltransferase family 32 protein [Pseudohyphozyma bogoriensis]